MRDKILKILAVGCLGVIAADAVLDLAAAVRAMRGDCGCGECMGCCAEDGDADGCDAAEA